jgi:hypothetical protein
VPRKRDTGDGEPYTGADEAAICDAIEAAMGDDYDDEGHPAAGGTPTSAEVTAEIEWAGHIDPRKPVRTTRLDGLDLRATLKAAGKLRQAERRDTGPLRSYKAKGWQAQLRELNAVKRGPEAKQAAGLNPSRETLRRWEKGTQKPSRANRRKIADAYDELRNPNRGKAAKARHQVAEELTKALKSRYGVNVRLRDIRDTRFL